MAILAPFSLAGCYGGPCADPTTAVLIDIVIPILFIAAVIYVRVAD